MSALLLERLLHKCSQISTVTDAQFPQGNQSKRFKYVLNRKEATSIKYFGDGSGRDGYVIKECGGLIPNYKDNDVLRNFCSSLRNN